MCIADMVYQTGFGDKVLPASICCVKVADIRIVTKVEGTADETFSHVGGANMDLEISGLGELLVTTKVCAGYLLAFLQ
jgi:hypothetical protein